MQLNFAGDVAIAGARIADVGGRQGPGRREIDATGLLVTPGWVDAHTHYDGQAMWDPLISPSCWHGVTTALFGNCGVGFAPVRSPRARTRAPTLAPGLRADVNLIDFERLRLYQPELVNDLPAGGRRFVQRVDGYEATLVAGTPIFEQGKHTGAMPGHLVRAGHG